MQLALRFIFEGVKYICGFLGPVAALIIGIYDLIRLLWPSMSGVLEGLLNTLITSALEAIPAVIGDWFGDSKLLAAFQDVLGELAKFNTLLPVSTIVTEFFIALAAIGGIRAGRWVLSFIPTLNAG